MFILKLRDETLKLRGIFIMQSQPYTSKSDYRK
jgi:hypothetical protein